MSITAVDKDPDKGTMTVTAEFDAPVERVWRIWSDPRQLERWWGPPGWPATVTEHDLTPGGTVSYFMTGPDGEHSAGLWRVMSVEPPHRLEYEDAFADADGNPNTDMPMTVITVTLEGAEGGTRMVIHSAFASPEAMEQLMEMGMEEGMRGAMAQIDELLGEEAA